MPWASIAACLTLPRSCDSSRAPSKRLGTSMNVYGLVRGRIVDALKALQAEGALAPGLDFSNVEVAPPRDAAHGDLASNAALVLAKSAKIKPRAIAELATGKLRADPDFEKIEVAGAGFLNFTFRPAFWQRVVAAILQEGAAYGR